MNRSRFLNGVESTVPRPKIFLAGWVLVEGAERVAEPGTGFDDLAVWLERNAVENRFDFRYGDQALHARRTANDRPKRLRRWRGNLVAKKPILVPRRVAFIFSIFLHISTPPPFLTPI